MQHVCLSLCCRGWFDAEIKPKLVSIEVGVHSLSATLSTCLKTVQRIDSIHSQVSTGMQIVSENGHSVTCPREMQWLLSPPTTITTTD
eukprot:2498886-Amphidinium_carterae.2